MVAPGGVSIPGGAPAAPAGAGAIASTGQGPVSLDQARAAAARLLGTDVPAQTAALAQLSQPSTETVLAHQARAAATGDGAGEPAAVLARAQAPGAEALALAERGIVERDGKRFFALGPRPTASLPPQQPSGITIEDRIQAQATRVPLNIAPRDETEPDAQPQQPENAPQPAGLFGLTSPTDVPAASVPDAMAMALARYQAMKDTQPGEGAGDRAVSAGF